MFHIKICGVRHLEEVQGVARSGADAVGLNFFPESIRYVAPADPQTAHLSQLAASLGLLRVGVFVNATAEHVDRVLEEVEIDVVQFHGDETPEAILSLLPHMANQRLIRAVKLPVGPLEVDVIQRATLPWVEIGCHPLFDADAGASHGGSGQCLDWGAIGRWHIAHPEMVFTLAGGLNPENVGEAIERTGATSVDTASGVESPRGRKDLRLVDDFVKAYRRAANGADGDGSSPTEQPPL